ncbi:LPS-assembly protein LptD [Acetobacteraceae bacterium EV16G]|uniref:LPS-assembly protein LptD n=1 Tax=Sorlinia euscelidii TaxID=3081148 RepID=A0ABU7U4R6_9PROT
MAGKRRRNGHRRRNLAAVALLGGVGLTTHDSAKAGGMRREPGPKVNIGKTSSSSEPVTYLADHESYTKDGVATWSGNVQIWQGDQAMRADKIVYDRNSGIMRAMGHIAMIEPDNSTIFTNTLELSNGMHNAIARGIYIRMQDNAKIAANGMRRTESRINDLSKVIYTACKTCEKNPDKPPFWQIRAYDAKQDSEHKRIEFSHAYLQFFGVPVFYFPLFSMTDPTVKRQSGFLMPGISPHDRYLGTYATIPYYWVINDSQDMTVQALVSTRTGPQISAQYRNNLRFGKIRFTGGVADATRHNTSFLNFLDNRTESTSTTGIQGYARGKVDFVINRNWRAGANVNVASSANYMRDYRITGYGNEVLASDGFVEGFGVGSWARLDAQLYQGLNQGVIQNSQLPFVLPRFSYGFQAQRDPLGGVFSLNTTDFVVYRPEGVNTDRAQIRLNWDRPFHNALGQEWLFTLRLDAAGYQASHYRQQPLYAPIGGTHTSGQFLPTAALKVSWPFMRSFAHGAGVQIIEPIAQIIASPTRFYKPTSLIPNEDSFQYEFTDSTLFSLNRYNGTDRLDSGVRGNIGLHGNWTWRGHVIDFLVGESIQRSIDPYRSPYDGLGHHLSSPVGRIRLSPNRFVDLTVRGRYNPYGKPFDYGEALVNTGVNHFHVNAGYIYEPITPYYLYQQNYRFNQVSRAYSTPISEITAGVSGDYGHYHASVYGRRSLSRKEFVSIGGDVGYANDCFGLDVMFIKQYTFIGGQQRNTTVLFNFTLKTIGTFGING